MRHLKHVKKFNELLIWKTCRKWVGCSMVCFTPNLFLQTFFRLGYMVVSMIHHSNIRALISGDNAFDRCFLVVSDQKSKSSLSIERRYCLQFRTHLLNNLRCWATFLPLVRVDAAKVLKSSLATSCLVVCPPTMCVETPSLILSTISWLFIESYRLDKQFGINCFITSWTNMFSTTFCWNPTS